jgi:transcriptional antiterminator NusG
MLEETTEVESSLKTSEQVAETGSEQAASEEQTAETSGEQAAETGSEQAASEEQVAETSNASEEQVAEASGEQTAEKNNYFQWYAVQSYAGQEKQAKKLLLHHLYLSKMEKLIEEIFIPEEEVTTKVKGKERKQLISYYPGYILIKMHFTENLWHLLQETSKISGFIGKLQESKPIPVPEKEINLIKQQIQDGTKQLAINSTYQIGQNVRIIDGSFNDFVGHIEQINTEKSSLVVAVNIFGRAVPVELNFDKVKANE